MSYFTFKAFLEFFIPHGPTRRTLQLHPTHQREGDRAPPPMPTLVRGPPTLRQVVPLSPFSSVLSLNLTSAHFELCMYLIHQDKTLPTPAKPISPPTYPIHRSHAAGETLLLYPPSTILDPPKTDLVAAIEDRRRYRRPFLLTQSPSLSRSISLSLNLSLFLPPSLSVWPSSACEWMELMDFVLFIVYTEIFYYKIFLEAEKMWETSRK